MRHEVIPFRNARRPAGRNPVVCNGGLRISGQLQQMSADGIEAMMPSQPFIGVELLSHAVAPTDTDVVLEETR